MTSGYVFSQSRTILEISNIELDDLKSAGFTLSEGKEISIYAVGSGEKTYREDDKASFMSDPGNMFAYAWILNAKNREMVWRMTYKNSRGNRGDQFAREFKGDIELEAGNYEVYYSAKKPDYTYFDDGFFSLGKFFNKLFGDEDFYEKTRDSWKIEIRGIDAIVHEDGISKYHKAIRDQAVVSMTGLDNSEFRQEGFKLKKGIEVEIYAIGETHGADVFDYGWIVNAENSEKIWETLPDKGKYAGGAIKNNFWREKLNLKPGSYWVYFVMDDSHSPDFWNANPPFDPDFYGITISFAAKKFDPGIVEPLIKQKVTPIIELTRLGDDEFVQEGFKLSTPMQVRIYALGEGRRGEMFDYGWIIDLKTGEKIWEMTYNSTRNAGGADKNRLVDQVITLAEGSYMVYFVTDDSHSYRGWNSSPPYNPANWGITIYPADPKINIKNIEKLEEALLAENIISQIIRVRDGRLHQERFELERNSPIRIYAIGEGDWDEM